MNVKDKLAKLPSNAKLGIFAALLIVGVLLLIFGGGGSGGSADGLDVGEIEKYKKELEGEISELCKSVRGAGEVRVAVSLSGGFEYVYATDKNGKIVTSGGDAGVIIKKKLPEIAGVGIVCSGGGDPSVKNQLISLVSAAYGIGTNRIFIAEAKKQS